MSDRDDAIFAALARHSCGRGAGREHQHGGFCPTTGTTSLTTTSAADLLPKASVYVIGPAQGEQKVGFSSNPTRRLVALQAGNACTLVLHRAVRMAQAEAQAVEAWAHFVLRWRLVMREWFEVTLAEAAWAIGTAVAIVKMGASAVPRCHKLPQCLPSILIPGIVDEVVVPELPPPAGRPFPRTPTHPPAGHHGGRHDSAAGRPGAALGQAVPRG